MWLDTRYTSSWDWNREHVWHKAFLMGYSMKLELTLVSSIDLYSLTNLYSLTKATSGKHTYICKNKINKFKKYKSLRGPSYSNIYIYIYIYIYETRGKLFDPLPPFFPVSILNYFVHKIWRSPVNFFFVFFDLYQKPITGWK